MPSPGERFGPYEITATIGRGGMGEVFRARDTRLNRDVAVKTSATQFSERFEREARAIASLNHPNICTLFDVGPNYLVMELVEGEPLKGPYPLDQALKYARQISSALEAAHEKQITHRDLKPGNILLTQDGVVKVLDFGLAKIGEPTRSESNLENSPTMTLGATVAGTILGTAAYMAPEQARGKVVDKRADIWAFGVVLFEILTGERLFKGEDITETLAAVVMKEPEWEKVPYEVRRLLKKCLQKDPKNRLRDIGDVWELLDGAEPGPSKVAQRAPKLPWIAAGVATLGMLGLAGWMYSKPPVGIDSTVVRFAIPPADGTRLTLTNSGSTQQALSPDGRYIVYVADDTTANAASQVLWLRALDSASAQRLTKTEGAFQPFWSPDSKYIAFFAENKLKRVPITGGTPLNVCDAGSSPGAQGGVWIKNDGDTGDGTILFAPNSSPIQRVPASGGVPAAVTKFGDGETDHVGPQPLPDGKRILYFALGKKSGIYVQDLTSGERTFLLETVGRAAVAPPDILLFMRDDALLAQRWDWSSLKPLSDPVVLADQVRNGGANGRSSFAVSPTGALVYRNGGSGALARYQWFSRDGKPLGEATSADTFGAVSGSPDGQFAVAVLQNGLSLIDLRTMVVTSLVTGEAPQDPVWSPDSRRIAFTRPDGAYQMVIGSGNATLVYPGVRRLEAWTSEGLLTHDNRKLALLPAPAENASGPVKLQPKILAEMDGDQFQISPDGKRIAYGMRPPDSGLPDIWVADYPSLTNRQKLAPVGVAPRWDPSGKELIFGKPYGIELNVIAAAQAGVPKLLLKVPNGSMTSVNTHMYLISPDGKRLLLRTAENRSVNDVEALQVVLNWPSLVK